MLDELTENCDIKNALGDGSRYLAVPIQSIIKKFKNIVRKLNFYYNKKEKYTHKKLYNFTKIKFDKLYCVHIL